MASTIVTTAFRQKSSGPGGSGNRVLRAVNRYVAVTMTYGAVRAVTYDSGKGTCDYYNAHTASLENKPMLFTHAMGRVVGRSFLAMLDWPSLLGQDIARLECAVRGLPFAGYRSPQWRSSGS